MNRQSQDCGLRDGSDLECAGEGADLVQSDTVVVDGHSIHYRHAGEGRPVLLLHGWPTSSFLWRNVMPGMAQSRRVLAIDLPGFGQSDKPLDVEYNVDFYTSIIDGFLREVGADEQIGLVVHDLGGPLGLYWASQRPGRLERLALLNTLTYPQLSLMVWATLKALTIPGLSSAFTSQWGLRQSIKFGVSDKARIRPDTIEGVCAPFRDRDSREALRRTLNAPTVHDIKVIAEWLPTVSAPVRIIYGKQDRILPHIERTVARLQNDIPHAEVTALDDCAHFLQEERPEDLAALLDEFFSRT